MNQITHAAFVAAFVAKHGVHPDAFKMEKRGDAWKAKMEVLDSLAQVPGAPELRGSVRGAYPYLGLGRGATVIPIEPTLGDFGAIGEDGIIAFANHNHAFATEV